MTLKLTKIGRDHATTLLDCMPAVRMLLAGGLEHSSVSRLILDDWVLLWHNGSLVYTSIRQPSEGVTSVRVINDKLNQFILGGVCCGCLIETTQSQSGT